MTDWTYSASQAVIVLCLHGLDKRRERCLMCVEELRNGSWLPLRELERLRAIEHAARDVDGSWDPESAHDQAPILWIVEAGECLLALRDALADPDR